MRNRIRRKKEVKWVEDEEEWSFLVIEMKKTRSSRGGNVCWWR